MSRERLKLPCRSILLYPHGQKPSLASCTFSPSSSFLQEQLAFPRVFSAKFKSPQKDRFTQPSYPKAGEKSEKSSFTGFICPIHTFPILHSCCWSNCGFLVWWQQTRPIPPLVIFRARCQSDCLLHFGINSSEQVKTVFWSLEHIIWYQGLLLLWNLFAHEGKNLIYLSIVIVDIMI